MVLLPRFTFGAASQCAWVRNRPSLIRVAALDDPMKSKVTAAELAEIAGVTTGLVLEYAKELRRLLPEDDVPS